MELTILGGGISGLSLAYFLQDVDKVSKINIIEKESTVGGLARSIKYQDKIYDIGPHIIFSKNKEILDFMVNVTSKVNTLKRSNQIIFKDKWVQYPFENDLSKLPEEDRKYCITSFNNNPYEKYDPQNMLQFFLKTFGEGITNLYLRPYNEKIWNFDPSFMNTSMVERIPKPTKEEIQRSANGETVDGYLHQLYFNYPQESGIESLVLGLKNLLNDKVSVYLENQVLSVDKSDNGFIVNTSKDVYNSEMVFSTIPVMEFIDCYKRSPDVLKEKASELKYNSILIAFVQTSKDLCGDNFTFTIPDKDVNFHRISKMDFLGDTYNGDGASYMVEITYNENDYFDDLSDEEIALMIKNDMCKINFAELEKDVEVLNTTRHKYAYVVYDLNHQSNVNYIRNYFDAEGVKLTGRFGTFEYWNMDKCIEESKKLAKKIICDL